MKTSSLKYLVLLFSALMLSSCTIAKIGGKGSLPLILNSPQAKTTVVEHFVESKMVVFDYTGSFDVSELLSEKLAKSNADAVTNMTIVLKSDVGTFFINLITLGLASAKRFEVSGDLVKAPNGLSSLLLDGQLLGQSKGSDPLKANLGEFMGNPGTSPMLVRTQDGYALVQPAK